MCFKQHAMPREYHKLRSQKFSVDIGYHKVTIIMKFTNVMYKRHVIQNIAMERPVII